MHASVFWALSLGCAPVSEPPGARLANNSAEKRARGAELFAREWTAGDPRAGRGDGLGPLFNARSCAGCHFLGGEGGAGPLENNVTLLDGQILHAESTDPAYAGWRAERLGRTTIFSAGLPVEERPAHIVSLFTIGERNTPPMWGLGAIDRIPDAQIAANVRESGLVTGRMTTDADGRAGRFGWKGDVSTLKAFVRQACSTELGLEVPGSPQMALPFGEPVPASGLDLGRRDLSALTYFAASLLPPPEPTLDDEAQRGEVLFGELGCAACHVPDLGGVHGIYSDLLLHDLGRENGGGGNNYYGPPPPPPPAPVPLTGTEPASPLEWRTPPLWGVADTAPYMHDGRASTLIGAIRAHNGEAKTAKEQFLRASWAERDALLAFLGSLKGPGLSR